MSCQKSTEFAGKVKFKKIPGASNSLSDLRPPPPPPPTHLSG